MSSEAPPPYREKNVQYNRQPSAPYSREFMRNNYMPVSEYGSMYEGVYKKPYIKKQYITNTNNQVNNNFVHHVPKKQPRYHGPVVSNDNEKLKITTKYYDKRTKTQTTNITYINKNALGNHSVHTVDQRNLNRNIRVDGLDPLPMFIDGHLARNSYFREQQRILKDKYNEDMLRLESQRVYSQIAYK